MPLHEYECRACREQFEVLVRAGDAPACPSCGSEDLERLLSSFGVSSEATRKASIAKARQAGAKELRDKQHAEAEEAAHHHDH